MGVICEIFKTFFAGFGMISVVVALALCATVASGILLYIPAWLMIGEGYYVVGGLYTLFVWGGVWRLVE